MLRNGSRAIHRLASARGSDTAFNGRLYLFDWKAHGRSGDAFDRPERAVGGVLARGMKE